MYNNLYQDNHTTYRVGCICVVSHPTCWDGSDGSVTLSSTGGTGGKTYSINGVNYYLTPDFANLSVGSYTGYVKDSNLCIDTVSFTLSKTKPSASVSNTNVSCNGGNDATITVSNPTGGNGGGTFSNYSVKLNSGSYSAFSSTSKVFSNITAGTHTIYLKDQDDCERSYSVTVTQPSVLSASYSSAISPTCDGGSDGSITWTRSGGTSPYTYTMNGSAITDLSQTNLSEGTYTFVVTDANGCTDSRSVILSKSAVAATVTQSNITCNGGSNGSITVSNPSGGNGVPYSVKLNNGSFTTSFPKTYSNLSAGTYTITVKDTDNCERTYSKTLTQPAVVSFTTTKSNPTCWDGSDGSITVTASGGDGVYQYSKNGGSTWQIGNSFTSLGTGSYSIRVKDGNGCLSSTSSVTLSKSAPSATINTTSVTCAGGSDGSIEVSNPTGGNGGGTFSNYDVKLGTGSWTSFSSTSKLYSNLSSGTYTVYLRDQDNCEKSYSATVGSPTANNVLITGFVAGSNGSITVTSGGGTWNKTYRLYRDSSSPYTVGGGSLVATITGVTSSNPTQTFSNLAEGYYYVVITDANGCTESSQIQSTFESDGGASPEACYGITPCTGGEVYWASVQTQCLDGVLSLAMSNFSVGQVVQFSIGSDCPNPDGATYCGTVTEEGVQIPTAIITNSEPMEGCEDFRCFE